MKTQLVLSLFLGSLQAIKLSEPVNGMELPPRVAHPLVLPSTIVHGEVPEGSDAIKASQGDGLKGPTFDHKFSDDEAGPHKVEVYRHMTQ